jgi:serine/threonine protein kinase
MPIEIPDTGGVRLGQFRPATEDARQLLFDITKSLQGRSGVLRLVQPSEGNMAYERARWSPFGSRGGAAQRDTTQFVQKLFYSAYQPAIDRLPEGEQKKQQQELLDRLVVDFTQTAGEKNHLFGKATLRTFFNRAELELTSEPDRLQVAEGRAAQDNQRFLPRIVEDKVVASQPSVVPDIDDFDKDGNYRPPNPKPLIGPQQVEPPMVNPLPQPLIAEPLLASAPVPFVRVLPSFQSASSHDLNALIQSTIGFDLSQARAFDKGGMAQVFKVPADGANPPCILKQALPKGEIRLKSLREYDATAIYLSNEKGRSIPGIVRSTDLFVAAQPPGGPRTFHHIPLANYPEAKRHFRQLAQPGHELFVVAQVMPFVEGRSLDRPDLTGPKNAAPRHNIARQLLQTVHALHHNGYLDRDIKPDNLIYNAADGTLSKIDNGMMVKFSKNPLKTTKATSLSGTPDYLAPHKLQNKQGYGPEADLYETAMTLARIKYGEGFLNAAVHRFENQKIRHGLSREFEEIQKKYPQMSYLKTLVIFAETKDPTLQPTCNALLNDLRNDPETIFIDKLFTAAMTSKPDYSRYHQTGRQEIYADYYRNLDALMNDPWLKPVS